MDKLIEPLAADRGIDCAAAGGRGSATRQRIADMRQWVGARGGIVATIRGLARRA